MSAYLDAMDAARTNGLPEAPRVLAALRPRMLRLAGSRTAGAVPFLVSADHTSRARALLGDGPLLAPVHAVVLDADLDRARHRARPHVCGYLRLPNYVASLRTLGFGDADLDPDNPSERLIDSVVACGPEARVTDQLVAHIRAGADHVGVMPAAVEHPEAIPVLEALAPWLSGASAREVEARRAS
jgi:probable F420-dependent oxidoreductase